LISIYLGSTMQGFFQPMHRILVYSGMILWFMVTACAAAVAEDNRKGEKIYRTRCAKCHGASGEGSDEEYPNPLTGDKSIEQLSRFIAKKMPKDSKQKCSEEESKQVSAYILDAFYSKAAQDRNKPPRIELARLTVRQYQNAIADLIGSFRTTEPIRPVDSPFGDPILPHLSPVASKNGKPNPGDAGKIEHGLYGEYFKSFGFRGKNHALERIDPAIKFDWGEAGPDKQFEPDRFSVRWKGHVFAPETGNYDFIVRTEHAVRLWVNDNKNPIIDGWVKSGTGSTEHSASIFLLGGRSYPLRLEFAKGRQGDKDGKKDQKKAPADKASISLEWKLPGQATDVIPSRNLFPTAVRELFILTTPFPPDDRSVGYERGTSISRAWEQATTDAAIEVAGFVTSHLHELAGIPNQTSEQESRVREFCLRFAERAFRRPLNDEQKRFFIDRRFQGAPDLQTAVKRVILLVLKSPQFLYRELGTGHDTQSKRDSYDVASRLAFGLWDSLPDQKLLEAAAAGQLTTREQGMAQAERMEQDPRTRAKIRDFLLQWLKLDPAPDLSKSKEFAGFDKQLSLDLRSSLELFLDDVVWSGPSDYRQLFQANYLYLNGRLAQFYGAKLPPDAPFQKVTQPEKSCAGILSHPYLMATFAYTASTSPIHRGVFLSRNVLGVPLRPPPEAFVPLPAELHPELTTRERVALQTRPEQCQSCHAVINPLGFTLENFDAVGRYREQEKGKPINAIGAYETRTGQRVTFNGVRDLANFLATSEDAQNAFIERLFHCLIKQPVRAYGPRTLSEMRKFFVEHNFNIRKLMVEMMAIEEKAYE
jgi:cytochrome c553